MGRWASKKTRYTVSDDLHNLLYKMYTRGRGRSRHADKAAGVDKQFIYTSSTYHTYMREGKHFREWLKQQHPEVRHLSQGKAYVNDYLQAQIDAQKADGAPLYSAYTISTRKASLARIYGLSGTDLIATPPRTRAAITRSRRPVEGDKHISAAKKAFYERLGRVTGLRRREMEHITGDALYRAKNGMYALHVTAGTKGGKPRTVLLYGQPQADIDAVVAIFQAAGPMRVAPRLPSHFDEHACRAEYARGLYNAVARPEKAIPPQDRYICRKDRAGLVLDRRAMRIVSQSMGHNRVDVIAEHYLYLPIDS